MNSRYAGGTIRTLTTVLVVLTIAGLSALAGPAARQAWAQEELPAALVQGDCDNPGEIAAPLRPLTIAEGGARTSFTTIDLAIADLTSGGYAILAGDTGAPVACGEIAGEGTDVYVAVQSRDDANLGGIAWLHARDDRTQVSLFLAENLGSSGTHAAPTEDPSSPPEPPDEKTPDAETPDEETPEPTVPLGDPVTYVSPNYGYSVTYDDERWNVDEETTEPGDGGPIDELILVPASKIILANFSGLPWYPDRSALNYVEGLANWYTEQPNYTDVAIRTDAEGNPIKGGDATHAFVSVDVTFTESGGKYNYQTECWLLPDSGAILVFIFASPQAQYDDWSWARESLSAHVQLPE